MTGLAEGGKVRVYVCEDEPLTRAYVVAGLSQAGIEALGVSDGRALSEAVELREPDIIVLDIGLPDEDGFAIAERHHHADGPGRGG